MLAGCNWGYGPPADHAKFTSAKLKADGTTCVFTFHDRIYRPATGLRAFPDGGRAKYVRDAHIIATVDVHTHQVNRIVDLPNREFLPGQGGFVVQDLRGDYAVVGQGGQGLDYEHRHRWWLLDTAKSMLSELDLQAEIAPHGRTVTHVFVGDAKGTLVLLTAPASSSASPDQQVWSRTSEGTLRNLASTEHYYGVYRGEIWYYDTTERAGKRTNLLTGTSVVERRADFAIPQVKPTTGCSATHAGLVHQVKHGDAWNDRPLPTSPADFR